MQKDNFSELFDRLSRSRFRSRFKLSGKDLELLQRRGLPIIREHARDFIIKRLAPAKPYKDGKQTPFKGHPVFVAQHATATCCRTCLYKWHHINKGKELSSEEMEYVLLVIQTWLIRQDTHTSSGLNSPPELS